MSTRQKRHTNTHTRARAHAHAHSKAKLSIQQDLVLQHLTELETKNTIIESLQDRLNVESSNVDVSKSELSHSRDALRSAKGTLSKTSAELKVLKTSHDSLLAINNALDLKVKTISGVNLSRQMLIGDLKAKIVGLEASVSSLTSAKKSFDELREQLKKMRADVILKEELVAGMKRKIVGCLCLRWLLPRSLPAGDGRVALMHELIPQPRIHHARHATPHARRMRKRLSWRCTCPSRVLPPLPPLGTPPRSGRDRASPSSGN